MRSAAGRLARPADVGTAAAHPPAAAPTGNTEVSLRITVLTQATDTHGMQVRNSTQQAAQESSISQCLCKAHREEPDGVDEQADDGGAEQRVVRAAAARDARVRGLRTIRTERKDQLALSWDAGRPGDREQPQGKVRRDNATVTQANDTHQVVASVGVLAREHVQKHARRRKLLHAAQQEAHQQGKHEAARRVEVRSALGRISAMEHVQ